jgi:hypothetical protein
MASMTLNVPTDATLVSESAADVAAVAAPGACTNCGEMREGEYCAACGQRAVRGRLTVPSIGHQVANEVLNMDRGLVFTALELSRRPGAAIREYVDGKRVRYTGPVKYFILTVALTTFATTQLGVLDEVATGMFHEMGPNAPVTPSQASAFMSQWMTLFMAVGVPFTAAVTHRLFRRAGMTYAEHLALNLYSYGHQCLILVLALLIGYVVPAWQGMLVTSWMFVGTAYFAWACTGFFGMRARRAVPLAFLGMALGTVTYFIAAAFAIGVSAGVAGL